MTSHEIGDFIVWIVGVVGALGFLWGGLWYITKAFLRPAKNFLREIFISDREQLKFIASQFYRNGGGSVLDRLETLQSSVLKIDRRQRAFSDLERMPIFETDENRRNVYVNKSYARILKTDDSSILGFGWKSFVHPDDKERVIKSSMECAKECRIYTDSFRMVDLDGESHTFDVIAYPQTDRDGKFGGYVGSLIEKSPTSN